MMAIERRLKAVERHHRGSVLSFSSECRFEPPGLSGKHPDSSFQTGVGAVGFPPAPSCIRHQPRGPPCKRFNG